MPRKILRKIPGKILQNLYNKNPPKHFCRLARAFGIPTFRILVEFRHPLIRHPLDSPQLLL